MRAAALSLQRSRTLTIAGGLIGACLASVIAGRAIVSPTLSRDTIALVIAFGMLVCAIVRPRLAVYALFGWLVLLGLLRRLLTSAGAGVGSFGDPLLLIAPAVLVVLFLIASQQGALRGLTPLAKCVLALTAVLALSALNPLQGGLSVGLGGLMLVVLPMLAFWTGRRLIDEHAFGVLVRLLGVLAIFAALYGLMQTFSGLPSWDAAWVAESGYAALHVGNAIRAFGTSVSAAEYAALLGVGLLAWRAVARSPARLLGSLAAFALLAVALWLESSRGIVVLALAALWLTFCAGRRIRIGTALAVGAVLLALLPTVVGSIAPTSEEGGALASLTAHQTGGLSKPFGSESTLNGHLQEMLNGITTAVKDPLGRGVGAITNAAGKFGGVVAGTEVDPGNAPVAAGFIGLGLYIAIAWYGLSAAYRLARERRSITAIAALGILAVTFLQWLNGGQYLIIALVWLTLGWVDGQCALAGLATAPRPRRARATAPGEVIPLGTSTGGDHA